MADLRTELLNKVLPKMKTLEQLTFDDPEQPEVPVAPENLTNNEIIFNWISQHPASYAKDICAALVKDINYDSVQSQIHALATRGILYKAKCSSTDKYMYSAAVDAYPRSARIGAVAKMNEARSKLGKDEMARRISEGHKANRHVAAEVKLEPVRKIMLVKRRTPEPVATPTVQVTPVDLNTLSIVQARKLYDELKVIFGG